MLNCKNYKKTLKLDFFFSFIFPVSIFVFIVCTYRHYIPMWDSREYLTACILPTLEQPFSLMAYNCFNHGSITYGLLYSFLQFMDAGNIYFVHLTSLILMTIAFYFLHSLLWHLFKNVKWVTLGMALICWNPSLLANTINPTPDLTVFAFSIMCLWSFLTNRLMLAPLFGIALLFSKESGIIYYGLCCFFYLVIGQSEESGQSTPIKLMLVFPFIFYVYFMWYKTQVIGQYLLFKKISLLYLLQQLFFINFHDLRFYSALSGIFILNFQWVVIGTLLFGIALFVLKKQPVQFKKKEIAFIGLLSISLCYVLSRFPHFMNVRYYLLIFPLTSLLFIFVLKNISQRVGFFLGTLFAFVLLLSCFRTIDPLSRTLYGTFRFGHHDLLNIVSISHECCGYGRDQLVYNLEHAQLQLLLNQFAKEIHLEKNDIVLSDPLVGSLIYGNVANDSYAWTLREKNTHHPLYATDPAALSSQLKHVKKGRIFYPDFPNFQNGSFKTQLFTHFKPMSNIIMQNKGYELRFIALSY